MRPQKNILYFLLASTIFVVSCDVTTLVAPQQNPSPVPNAINIIIGQTAAAASTQTAKAFTPTLTPSFTPFPTKVPSDTPTVTVTFIYQLLSPTNNSILITPSTPVTLSTTDYDCQLTGQSPPDGSTVTSNQDFETTWTVANTGRLSWDSRNVDFIYLSGAKLGKSKVADLPKTVASGQAISLKITMTAPKNSGSYKTFWTLRIGKNEFCKVSVSIAVR